MNYDTPRRYLNVNQTDFFLFSFPFGVAWPSKLGCSTFSKLILPLTRSWPPLWGLFFRIVCVWCMFWLLVQSGLAARASRLFLMQKFMIWGSLSIVRDLVMPHTSPWIPLRMMCWIFISWSWLWCVYNIYNVIIVLPKHQPVSRSGVCCWLIAAAAVRVIFAVFAGCCC